MSLNVRPLAVLTILATLFLSGHAMCEGKRVALVIGNGAYSFAGRLSNPINDATDVGLALKRLGFEVTTLVDTNWESFAKTTSEFLTKANGADIALFYYAGHGFQYNGASYLLPVDAKLENEFAIKRETISAQDIVSRLEAAAGASIVVLDACRTNPLAEQLQRQLLVSGRSLFLNRGLGRLEAASGNTLIVYSAGPGQVAEDGMSRNSPFTTAFLNNLETPGLEVEQMLKRVTADVERITEGKQHPERLSRLKIELVLKRGNANNAVAEPRERPQSVSHKSSRLEVSQSNLYKLPHSWNEYIEKYPFDSTYVDSTLAQAVTQASNVRQQWSKLNSKVDQKADIPLLIERFLQSYRYMLTEKLDDTPMITTVKEVGPANILGNEVYVYAAFSIAKGSECHACQVKLSLFELRRSDTLSLGTVSVGLGKHGGWGSPPESIQIVAAGKGIYAVVITDGWAGQGYVIESQTLAIPIAGSFAEVLSSQVSEDDGGSGQNKTSWTGRLGIVAMAGYFPKVVFARSGKKDEQPISEEVTYQFDERVAKYLPQRR